MNSVVYQVLRNLLFAFLNVMVESEKDIHIYQCTEKRNLKLVFI